MTWMISGLFQRLTSAESPESPKAATLLISAAVLCLTCGVLGLACSIWIYRAGDLGLGAGSALLGSLGLLAGLAGLHRQKDPGDTDGEKAKGTKDQGGQS